MVLDRHQHTVFTILCYVSHDLKSILYQFRQSVIQNLRNDNVVRLFTLLIGKKKGHSAFLNSSLQVTR